MKKLFVFIFLLSACTVHEKEKQKPFPVFTISDDEWATYEGKWLNNDGVIRFELSLKSGGFGVDSYYKLVESFESDSLASGTESQGSYSTHYGFANKEVGICLHDLSEYSKGFYLRYKPSQRMDIPEEMFFITHGNDELVPSDDHFKPITTDRRYTLHQRSKLFTVEGYITFEHDTATFFERNTCEHWKVTNLGEFNEIRSIYKQLAKVKYEGIYLKALAYSVTDPTFKSEKDALVIKQIKDTGNDPDAE